MNYRKFLIPISEGGMAMANLDTVNRLHHIVDGYGNYYRINGNNQLIVATGRENAGVFTFFEANQRIGGGKKSYFYSAVPIDEDEETEYGQIEYESTEEEMEEKHMEDEQTEGMQAEDVQSFIIGERGENNHINHIISDKQDTYYSDYVSEDCSESDTEIKMCLPYDMKCIDWKEYLTHFCYIASEVHNYQDELNQSLSDIDMQICDILHYIELYNLDTEDDIRMIELLKECREQRRDVKDEMLRIECFQKAIGNSSNVARAKDGIKQINKLDTRIYHPRKLKKLFKDCPEKTVRDSKLIRALENDTCMDIKQSCFENREIEYAHENFEINSTEYGTEYKVEEGEDIMEYTKQRTVFDGKNNNWKQFAKEQFEFYSNAEQYIYNLQDDINELDEEIEDTLNEIEDA